MTVIMWNSDDILIWRYWQSKVKHQNAWLKKCEKKHAWYINKHDQYEVCTKGPQLFINEDFDARINYEYKV